MRGVGCLKTTNTSHAAPLFLPKMAAVSAKRSIKIDLFADTAAILISIVSNSYYGMLRGQIHINLPPEYPVMYFETTEIKMAAVSAKRSITSLLVSSPQKDPLKLGTRESGDNLSKLFRYDSSLALLFRLVKCCEIVRDCTKYRILLYLSKMQPYFWEVECRNVRQFY